MPDRVWITFCEFDGSCWVQYLMEQGWNGITTETEHRQGRLGVFELWNRWDNASRLRVELVVVKLLEVRLVVRLLEML